MSGRKYHTYKLRWAECFRCHQIRQQVITYSSCRGNYRAYVRDFSPRPFAFQHKTLRVGDTFHFVCEHNQPCSVTALARASWEGPWRRNKEREAMISLGWKETLI